MEHKTLGDTQVLIPEIGLGAAGYTAGVGPLREGISAGAYLIDTAESYETEDKVGAATLGMRDRVFIATKVSPRHFKHEDLIAAAEGSLGRLGTDYIDLYQLHAPNPDINIAETMGAIDQLVEQGKVRFVGVSNFSVAQLEEAQAATRNKIVANQVRYSLFDRSVEDELLPYCQENDVTLIAYSPLNSGIRYITGEATHKGLESVAEATGKTRAQIVLNWCTSRENVVAIPRSNSKERTRENCDASGWRLSPEQVRLLDEVD